MTFKFTHRKNSDGRLVGILPAPTTNANVAYAFQAPSEGGQTYEMGREEFNKQFSLL